MNDNNSETLQFPSLPPHERSLKRRRLDELDSNTSSNDFILGTHWELKRVKRELSTLRTKLAQTEATVIEHHKLRKQTEVLFEKEKNILQTQVQVDKEMIKQLQDDLGTSVTSFLGAREAQAAAEAELSLMKTSMEQRIAELEEANWKSQQEIELQNSELEKSKMMIERLNSGKRTFATRKIVVKSQEGEREAVVTEKSIKRPSILFNKSGHLRRMFLAKRLNRKVPLTDTNDSRASSSRISDKENLSPSAAPFRYKVGSSSYSSPLARVKYVDDSSSDSSESSMEFSSDSSLEPPSDSSLEFSSDSSSAYPSGALE